MKWVTCAAVFGLMSVGHSANADDKLTVYSYRQAFLVEPILTRFTEETGIGVNLVFAKDGIAERLVREGRLSPADLVLTSDFSRLVELVDKDLTSPVKNPLLESNIPAQYRDPDGQWYALTMRVRNLYTAKDRLGQQQLTYEELADPKYKGKICTRSGKHPYNIALVASMIAHHGEAEAKTWLQGVKTNLARKPQGNDRGQIAAVKEGVCEIAIGNSYYYGNMLQDPEQKAIAEAVTLNFPNQADRGAHVNVSGMVLTRHAPNKANAIKLMEFLSADVAQKAYADVNMEYPVKADVAPSSLVASWGKFKSDQLPIFKLAEYHQAAVKLLDEVQFDL
ncbi:MULTISPECIES: Fe(3+) ABC transporter substrate-binding protein [Shewanella]|jgi:iron(III) transport system substrate-binding protein|uniref:Fe(3+) ABC transporter substrate-binding protein n=1 Tax=Shewanella TaxID=22 RepID=UPI000DEAC385|nr:MULTISPECIES: Fe(3+) ABC transporter substrate-binding protein [unclassified Shewanella]RBP82146.1 iron(III) transport system substrate-binding protein [Shewanella putrefaciens]MBP6519005.1 Fe(3+) ABC transporter substrate-binding protein [Shewanella sp.]MBS0041393.1 Fe(3+) ABC transporter substrate-binding protein [Shewanella sp. M16]MCU7977829.1 Fe(3+) ABC transporter substrate-binding protein [Shewanella sp. SW36]MCU7993086.1 Fe(3+) ABC transporter substrate-binding protein [Shewanella s